MSYFDQRGRAKHVYVDTHAWNPKRMLSGLGEAAPPSPDEFYMPEGYQAAAIDETGKGIRPEFTTLMQLVAGMYRPETIPGRRACSPDDVVGANGVAGELVIDTWKQAGLMVVLQVTKERVCLLGMTVDEYLATRGDRSLFFVGSPTRGFWAQYKTQIDKATDKVGPHVAAGMTTSTKVVIAVGVANAVLLAALTLAYSRRRRS